MADIGFPAPLVDLQRASTAAWAALEAYRREVDAARVADADAADQARRAAGERLPEVPSWGRRELRPWTPGEDAVFGRLRDAVRQAAEALRAGIQDAGQGGGYEVAQGLHAAAREE